MIRILTEDKNRETIYRILGTYAVDSFTVTPAIGFWKGKEENSLAIDIVGISFETARVAAQAIKAHNNQQCVLVLDIPATSHFI